MLFLNFFVKLKEEEKYCTSNRVGPSEKLKMMEAGPKAHGLFHCEPVVKIEPPEDVKDIKTSDPDLDFFVNHSNSTSSSQTPSIWPYLLKTVR